jgi:hypothetical protein
VYQVAKEERNVVLRNYERVRSSIIFFPSHRGWCL